jgi:NADPH:quinone reductase-like Zn-dependent oxidoreductase
MKALRFHSFGDLNALSVEEMPVPRLSEGEVLVQIKAASVNPSDVKNVQGRMEGTTLPRVPGRDFSGIVIDGPEQMKGLEVWGAGGDVGFTRDGSHAEAIVVPTAGVRPKPKSLSFEAAAAAGVNFITAYLGLVQTAGVHAGETVLVTGARGGVGSAVIQLAAWKSAQVFAVDRQAAPDRARGVSREFAGSTDADYAAIVDQVLSATGGRGVDVVFDTVGGPLFEPCLRMLGRRGRQVNISATGVRRVSFDLLDFYRKSLSLFGIDTRALDTVASAAILEELTPAFESGALAPPNVQHRFTLENLVEAYRGIDQNSLRGKAVLVV